MINEVSLRGKGYSTRALNKWYTDSATFGVRSAVAGWSHGSRVRFLLVSDGQNYTSEQQFAPMVRHAHQLQNELGVVMATTNIEDGLSKSMSRLARFDVIGMKLSFRTPAERVVQIASHFRSNIRAGAKIVYFDGDDDSNILWPQLLPLVDLYVKKHAFVDLMAYEGAYIGKNNLTDYVARKFGVSFADDFIPASGGVSREHLGKLFVGWNIGMDDPIAERAERAVVLSKWGMASRHLDLTCRASVAPSNWIYGLRNSAVAAIKELEGQFNVSAPTDRVSKSEYLEEILRSKVVVSPFGYGEICWRDFETILSGAVLFKPDMSHIRTWPDIFVPYETYIPLKWDYSDLREKAEHYVNNPGELAAIAGRARSLLLKALSPSSFIGRFKELLARL